MSNIRPARENALAVLATNPLVRAAVLAVLRAEVEALPARGVVYPYDLDSLVPETLLYRADVLALLDGGSDE